MEFAFGVVCFILGTVLVAVCLAAIPGPAALEQTQPPAAGGHGSH